MSALEHAIKDLELRKLISKLVLAEVKACGPVGYRRCLAYVYEQSDAPRNSNTEEMVQRSMTDLLKNGEIEVYEMFDDTHLVNPTFI